MGKKQLREAAAHMRAARHAHRSLPSAFSQASKYNPSTHAAPLSPIVVDLDSDGDCNYFGGVNCHISDSEYDSSAESGSNFQVSDKDESLAELEGDALEENLRELRGEMESPRVASTAPSRYDLITAKKSVKEWQRAEKNRSLGYTGTSTRTKQRKAKAA